MRNQRDYFKKLAAAQQNPAMRMAMMQGMMGMGNPAMQMAMMQQQMGMMSPQLMAMQQASNMQAMLGMMKGKKSSKRRRRDKDRKDRGDGAGKSGRRANGSAPAAANSGSSSSTDSSSDDDSGEFMPLGMMPPGMQPGMPPMGMWPGHPGLPGSSDNAVEAFLAQCPVEPDAADRLRALPPHLQKVVIARGPVAESRNPSAVLIARVRDAELGRGAAPPGQMKAANDMGDFPGGGARSSVGGEAGGSGAGGSKQPQGVRKSAKSTIESMISEFGLSPGCAWMMRALPPDKQKMASRIDPTGQADPSGYVAEQLQKIV